MSRFVFEDSKAEVLALETKRREILVLREAERRLKIIAKWIEKGDENTNFFHEYMNHRKCCNTVRKIKDGIGRGVDSFYDIATARIYHFYNLFREEAPDNIAEMMFFI